MLATPAQAIVPVLAQFLDPDRGPEPTGDFRVSPTFFLVLVLAGFAVGAFGHVIRSKTVVAMGVTMIFLGTVLLPLGIAISR